MGRGPLLMKIARIVLPTLGAAAGAGAYVLAGGQWGGTASLLIMHCGVLLGLVTARMIQSAALVMGHLPPEGEPSDAEADALIDQALERRAVEAGEGSS